MPVDNLPAKNSDRTLCDELLVVNLLILTTSFYLLVFRLLGSVDTKAVDKDLDTIKEYLWTHTRARAHTHTRTWSRFILFSSCFTHLLIIPIELWNRNELWPFQFFVFSSIYFRNQTLTWSHEIEWTLSCFFVSFPVLTNWKNWWIRPVCDIRVSNVAKSAVYV